MVFISGSISYIYLKKNTIKLLLLLDDHENEKYCNNKSICIDKFIKKFIYKSTYNIYIEEPLDNTNLHMFWSSLHTKKIKNLYEKNKKHFYPIDIRYIINYDNNYNTNYNDFKLHNIVYNIYYLFSYLFKNKLKFDINENENKSKLLKNLKKNIKLLIIKHSKNKYIKRHIIKIINCIKNLYNYTKKINILLKQYIKQDNIKEYDLIGFPYNNYKLQKNNCLIYYDFLINSIMEFYFILLLFESKNNNILYAGAYHCINIIYILVFIYKFEIKKKSKKLNIDINNTKLENIVKKFTNNCIKL